MRISIDKVLFGQLVREGAKKLDAQLQVKIDTLKQRQAAIRQAVKCLAGGGRKAPLVSSIPVPAIIARFRRQQGKLRKDISAGRRRQITRMRALHADPAWRKKHGYPPPKKS